MKSIRYLTCLTILALVLALTGCFRSVPIRHLSAEVCLLAPAKTTKPEVVAYLGEPAERQVLDDNNEVWIYHQVKKSLLREAPYIGDQLGHEEYELVTVTFQGDLVSTCVYRVLSEEEFKQEHLAE